MKLERWLSPRNSAINGHAIVRVEAGEVADFEAMQRLVDHDTPHFGVRIRLCGIDEPPRGWGVKHLGFGNWPAPSKVAKQVRFYDVFVDRD